MNPFILQLLDILQRLSLASISVMTARVSFGAIRALTKYRKSLDFLWLVFFSFGANRLYFTIRASIYHRVSDTLAQADSLIVGYVWIIANCIAVTLAYNWYKE